MKNLTFYIAILCAVITAILMTVIEHAPISIGIFLILFVIIIFKIKAKFKNIMVFYLYALAGIIAFIIVFAGLLFIFKNNELITNILLYPSAII